MYGELLPLMERSKILHWVRKSLPYEILDDAETSVLSALKIRVSVF